MRKPSKLPIIDMSGKVGIIDLDSNCKPFMRILGTCPAASVENAKRILEANGFRGGWLIDQTGDKQWVGI